jgi:tyrosinase
MSLSFFGDPRVFSRGNGMLRIRKDVWKLPPGDKTLFWYGKAIEQLKGKSITDITSWWSLAAMHGIDRQLWIDLGYLDPTVTLPFDPDQQGFWNQCQHGSWYFLPWHRGYLAAFEAILLDAIVKQNGPTDWALPYWNYDPTNPKMLRFPEAFAPELLDDGSKNPLWVKERYGRLGDGVITIKPSDVPVKNLWKASEFFVEPGELPTDFGGTRTAFHHDAGAGAGLLERVPHGPIHNFVGGTIKGTDPSISKNNGLMSMFETAGIDPIFWLHHSNIDRLWEVWLNVQPSATAPPDAYKNPTEPDWLNQPAGAFVMPRPDGTTFTYTARQMLNTKDPSLNYQYEDISVPPGQANLLAMRLQTLGVTAAAANQLSGAISMASPKTTELVGSNSNSVRIGGNATDARVQLDPDARDRMSATLSMKPMTDLAAPGLPDRVFLALENITSSTDAGVFYVYVNLPKGADPEQHPEFLAGVVSMFGARAASEPSGPHAGNGLTQTMEITDIVDAMHLNGALDAKNIDIKFVPQTPISVNDKIDVGRVKIYRQSR